ncbi:MAG: hypothetical protein ABIV63_05370 [Caldimonas sp.]
MEHTSEQAYTDLMRLLASPMGTKPETLANTFREVERMHSLGQVTDWQLQNAREAYASTSVSKVAEAADWALETAKGGLRVGADLVRDYTRTAVTKYTLRDPVRAVVIAAGTGALLTVLVAVLVRSGARKVGRKVRR